MSIAGTSRKTLGQLIQQGWNEIPEVFASTGMALIGVAMGIAGVRKYYKEDGDNRRYKMTYVIMRPDDPNVQRIRKD